jgi:two-component system, sensor histidine kinase and response regulator
VNWDRLLFGLVFCGLVAAHAAHAQQAQIDSLLAKLQPGVRDTGQVNLHNELAWQYMTSDPAATQKHAQAALALAEELKYGRGQVLALHHLGDYHWRHGEYALAVDRTTQSLKMAAQQSDSLAMADAHRQLGIIYSFGLHQYPTALRHQNAALGIYERHSDGPRTLGLYGNIAWVYCMMRQELPLARAYTQKALAISRQAGDDRFMGWALNSMGLVCLRQGQPDSALHYLAESNRYAARAGDRAVTLYNYNLMGEVYLGKRNYPAAKKLLLSNLADIQRSGFSLLQVDAHLGLATAYEALGQYDSAHWHFKSQVRTRDSLQNIETAERIAIIEASYAEEQRQAKIDYLEKERLVVSSVVATVLLALLTILGITVRNNQQRKRNNALLQAKNTEIAQQNEELAANQEKIMAQRNQLAEQNQALHQLNQTKDKLFAIIGHDLRAPINSLRGLLGMLTSHELSVDDFLAFSKRLQDGAEHVYATLTNLLLWANSQLTGISPTPKPLLLRVHGEEAIHLLTQVVADKGLRIDNQILDNLVAQADPDQVGLVLRNLLSNAVKFSYSKGQVVLLGTANGQFCQLAVRDHGVGMSAENAAKLFNKTATHFTTYGTKGEKGTGLGLLLCQEMVEANGGKIWVESTPGQGTTFYFTLPVGEPARIQAVPIDKKIDI